MLRGREEGAGWWACEHSPGKEEVGGLDGVVGDWRPDLVNKSAENNSLDFSIYCKNAIWFSWIQEGFRGGSL